MATSRMLKLVVFFALVLLMAKVDVLAYNLSPPPKRSDRSTRPPEKIFPKVSKIDQNPTQLVAAPREQKTSRESTKLNIGSSSYPSISYGYGRYSYLPSLEVDQYGDDNGERSGTFFRRKKEIARVSNIASILCIVDCTVLPIITVIFPIIGWASSPGQMEWIHALGHSIAIYFVIPVGGFAALTNYLSHKRPLLSLPAAVGLSLIYLANVYGGPILSNLPHELMQSLHSGTMLHRMTNIAGCALLLGSNYVSHRVGCSHSDGNSCGRWDCRSESESFFSWEN